MATFQPKIFNLGEELYGINIIYVSAIEQTQKIVRVPNSSDSIKGIINLRGEVIPVIDLKAKFGLAGTDSSQPELIIVNNNNRKIALEVDGVQNIRHIEDEDIVDMPGVAKGDGVRYFNKVAKAEGRLIIMIEPEYLLTEEESSVVDNLIKG